MTASPQNPVSDRAEPRSPLGFLIAVHRKLLPNDPEIGWTPYLWLFYLSMPVWGWIVRPPSALSAVLGVVSLAVFLGLYFNGFWRHGRALLWNIGGIVVLGLLWSPFNPSALVFFIYAAGFAGAVGLPKVGRRVLFGIVAIVALFGLGYLQHLMWTALTVCLCGMIGAINIYYSEVSRKNKDLRRSQEEVERLATIAERERISRDLHDLLGHTLSLITLKAELARKLSERGDERAASEIADVERISREALRQVREAVEGFREAGLEGELARARLICEARNIELETSIGSMALDTRQEAILSMVLREAVTNVARHARASHCQILFERDGQSVILRVHDNGRGSRGLVSDGSAFRQGHGLLGMRERLAELGGELRIDTADGWMLEARLPGAAEDGVADGVAEDGAARRAREEAVDAARAFELLAKKAEA